MRFYDVQRGRILLDGVDLRDWDLQSLRENFAVVLQDIFLFSGTVEGNIRLGRDDYFRRARALGGAGSAAPTSLSNA